MFKEEDLTAMESFDPSQSDMVALEGILGALFGYDYEKKYTLEGKGLAGIGSGEFDKFFRKLLERADSFVYDDIDDIKPVSIADFDKFAARTRNRYQDALKPERTKYTSALNIELMPKAYPVRDLKFMFADIRMLVKENKHVLKTDVYKKYRRYFDKRGAATMQHENYIRPLKSYMVLYYSYTQWEGNQVFEFLGNKGVDEVTRLTTMSPKHFKQYFKYVRDFWDLYSKEFRRTLEVLEKDYALTEMLRNMFSRDHNATNDPNTSCGYSYCIMEDAEDKSAKIASRSFLEDMDYLRFIVCKFTIYLMWKLEIIQPQ